MIVSLPVSLSLAASFAMYYHCCINYILFEKYVSKVDYTFLDKTPATINNCALSDDVMSVSEILLIPNPPEKNSNVSLVISGNLTQDLTTDSYMLVSLKKGPIKFPKIKMNLCDFIQQECPIKKGYTDIKLKFEIPKEIPGGSYDVETVMYNGDVALKHMFFLKNSNVVFSGNRIACLSGSVVF